MTKTVTYTCSECGRIIKDRNQVVRCQVRYSTPWPKVQTVRAVYDGRDLCLRCANREANGIQKHRDKEAAMAHGRSREWHV